MQDGSLKTLSADPRTVLDASGKLSGSIPKEQDTVCNAGAIPAFAGLAPKTLTAFGGAHDTEGRAVRL